MKDNVHLLTRNRHFNDRPDSYFGQLTTCPIVEGGMPELKTNLEIPVDIEITGETPGVFSFTAQYRIPGYDYVDFATAKDSVHVGQSVFRTQLHAPLKSYTDLRIYFLIDGQAKHAYRVKVQCSQAGAALGPPIVCKGKIGDGGKIVFETAEATFV
jgi:hypothetical protein